MTDERDPLLDEIAAALSVEPTPAFAAQVRSEIESERVAPRWQPYVLMAAAAAVALAVAGTVLLRPVAPASPATIALVGASQSAVLVPMPQVSETERGASALAAAEVRRIVPVGARREPEVLVPPDQAEALRRLVADLQAGRPVFPPARPRIREETGELLPLPEIAAIEVPALAIDPLPGGDDAQETRGIDD